MSALKIGAAMAVGVVLGAAGLAAAQSAAQTVLPLPTGRYIGKKLGLIDIDPVAFPCMKGYQLGLSYTIAPPGAGLAPHSHKAQWEVVQIVSGVLSVQRNGGPIEDHGPGDVMLNDQSVGRHAVLNRGTEPAVFHTAALGKPGGPAPPTQ